MMSSTSDSERSVPADTSDVPSELSSVPTFSLPPFVERFLERDENKPFATDQEYYEAVIACETARCDAFNLKTDLANTWVSPTSKGFASLTSRNIMNGQQLGQLLDDLTSKLNTKREKILQHTKRRPIIEAFLDAMEASDQEKTIFRYVFASVSGVGRASYSPTVLDICGVFSPQLALSDVMNLSVGQSKWVKERVYARVTLPSYPFSTMGGHGDTSNMLLAFMGVELTLTQYQELESPTLQAVLLEDEAFQSTEVGKAVTKHKDAPPPPPDDELLGESPLPLVNALSKIQRDAGLTVFDALASNNHPKDDEGAGDAESTSMLMEDDEAGSQVMQDASSSPEERFEKIDGKELQSSTTASDDEEADKEFGPYRSDLEYLEDAVVAMEKTVHLNKAKRQLDAGEDSLHANQAYDSRGYPMTKEDYKIKLETDYKKLETKLHKLQEKIQFKLAATRAKNSPKFPMPRLEQLVEAMKLQTFEKFVILALVQNKIMPPTSYTEQKDRTRLYNNDVREFVESFSVSLEEKMRCREFFYKSSTLVKEGIITISQVNFMTDLTCCAVELDRRMFDFLVGLDTEFSETVDGSHLYVPDVALADVILPEETKKQICDAVFNFEKVDREFRRLDIDKKITYGLGQVLLFYGASGTGKTMLANALAAYLKKKVLLVNFPDLGTNTSGELIKFLFREAKINKALLFFDECESLFKSREYGCTSVNMILTELEKFQGLCILATNRPCDLDEAMFRRITMAVEFKKPDHIMRKKIWTTLRPPKLQIDEGINFKEISLKFELTGGHIKNAWLRSLGLMVQAGREKVTQADLMKAASEQVTSSLGVEDFESRVLPVKGIDGLVVSPQIKKSLSNIVRYSKAQNVLNNQWGFDEVHRVSSGVAALFTGIPGTGKTMAAEAIGFDLGKPIKLVNVAHVVSKWVGETGKNIESLFADAKKNDAVLVFDEAEGLFGKRSIDSDSSVSRHDTINVGLLLQLVEKFSGICIVITNQKQAIDKAFFRRFQFVLDFESPSCQMREDLWKKILPPKCPLADDVDLKILSKKYDMSGGNIKSVVFRAATHAALRDCEDENNEDHVLHMSDLVEACEEEVKKDDEGNHHLNMYA